MKERKEGRMEKKNEGRKKGINGGRKERRWAGRKEGSNERNKYFFLSVNTRCNRPVNAMQPDNIRCLLAIFKLS